jgi:hypothetical protein
MTELRSVAAADRFRVFQDALRRRDQQQADQQRSQVESFDSRLQREAQATADTRRAEQRVQDRRDIIEAERALQDQLADQQRTRDFIANDDSFVRRSDAIETELNSARDSRDLNENILVRQLAGDRNDAAELQSLQRRQEDARLALIDRDARVVQRRIEDRNAAIQQELQLQRSIERIRSESRNAQSGAERPRGAVLDVTG